MTKINIENVVINGIELEIGFYFYPEEKQTFNDPGYPAEIEPEYINHLGEDISELLSEKIFDKIIEQLFEIKKQKDSDVDVDDRIFDRYF